MPPLAPALVVIVFVATVVTGEIVLFVVRLLMVQVVAVVELQPVPQLTVVPAGKAAVSVTGVP
jgi:hypothetical protein